MAGRGRIRAADIALVRERAKVEDVIGEHLQLKRAGSSLKGLCPFHDEKSPSFHVTPTRQLWNCFGCGEGGDVITFVQKIDHLSFSEAVELLAGKVGVQLQYEDDGGRPTGAPDRGAGGPRPSTPSSSAHRRPRRPGSSSPTADSTGRSRSTTA